MPGISTTLMGTKPNILAPYTGTLVATRYDESFPKSATVTYSGYGRNLLGDVVGSLSPNHMVATQVFEIFADKAADSSIYGLNFTVHGAFDDRGWTSLQIAGTGVNVTLLRTSAVLFTRNSAIISGAQWRWTSTTSYTFTDGASYTITVT